MHQCTLGARGGRELSGPPPPRSRFLISGERIERKPSDRKIAPFAKLCLKVRISIGRTGADDEG